MDEQLLIRFLTHTCTPEDLRSIDQWIASGKPNADWLFEMERIWSLKDELRFSDRREIEEAYNRFTLSQGKSKNAKYNPQNQKSRFQKRKIKKNGKRFVDSLYSLIDLKTI